MEQLKFYIIEDLSTWSTNAAKQSDIERFETLTEALEAFKKYRLNDFDYTDNRSKLVLGLSLVGAEADLIHVRLDQNTLITDFIGSKKLSVHPDLTKTIREIHEAIKIEKVRTYVDAQGNRLKQAQTLDFSEWKVSSPFLAEN